MKRIVLGILAHVDAGKTTLSEALLYKTGVIRKQGRVDSRDSFLDTYAQERARGITIFSKQAIFSVSDTEFTLLDTPGHVDFSAETERTLHVLDYAILVISGSEGIQGHTRTLWNLLSRCHIPVFIFVNKTDMPGVNKSLLMEQLHNGLSENIIDFSHIDCEETALCDEELLDEFLATGEINREKLIYSVKNRKVFPCFFGSALRLEGIDKFIEALDKYALMPVYPNEFAARTYKISRDSQGNRLTFLKVTGGSLTSKMPLIDDEKVNQIRIYSGDKFQAVNEALPGMVCAITGISSSKPGQSLGVDNSEYIPLLEPVLSYSIILPDGTDALTLLPMLRQLEEEEPELHVVFNEIHQEISVQVMGPVQTEILKNIIADRYGINVEFGTGSIVYKETIADTVEGVGHFEPLRHYAEVHLILEPGERGSGTELVCDCSEDSLSRNWQRLIMTHLAEKHHKGVLTNSALTDVKITLVAGRAHKKHTGGGDFRQAVYRAVRQGLMQATSILLEPYYSYTLTLPQNCIGHAMTDFERMGGTCNLEETGEISVLSGKVPVRTLGDYHIELSSYTKGEGRLNCQADGYYPCTDSEKVINEIGYNPERDTRNSPDSVFCANGSGFIVPWYEVKNYMHLESVLKDKNVDSCSDDETSDNNFTGNAETKNDSASYEEDFIGTDEIDAIINRTSHANSHDGQGKWKHTKGHKVIDTYNSESNLSNYSRNFDANSSNHSSGITQNHLTASNSSKNSREPYLLVDGYNIIFAWNELNELSKINLDAARGALLDRLCNYQAIKQCNVIVVFDAYRVKGHDTEISNYNNIHVVFTKEAETADQYIEKFAHEHSKKYNIRVATSDGLEQIIILGQGCTLVSAREFEQEVIELENDFRENYVDRIY